MDSFLILIHGGSTIQEVFRFLGFAISAELQSFLSIDQRSFIATMEKVAMMRLMLMNALKRIIDLNLLFENY
jgi:hypothetical protein